MLEVDNHNIGELACSSRTHCIQSSAKNLPCEGSKETMKGKWKKV